MDSDRPIKDRVEDRLGFSPVAEHLARVLVAPTIKDGLVFGIEGKWGSGKSTLINLTTTALRNRQDNSPEIVEFSPWLIGERDSLISHLFEELAAAACRIDPVDSDKKIEPRTFLEKLSEKIHGPQAYRFRQKELLRKKLAKKLQVFGNIAGVSLNW